MKTRYDAILLGAGVAGLTCARELSKKGLNVLVIEARDRIGGRIFSNNNIEYGAEFIHGAPPILLKYFESQQLSFYDVRDCHHFLKKQKMALLPTFWDRLEKVTARLNCERKQDRSIQEFLAKTHGKDSDSQKLFKAFVEGFYGADTALAGEIGLAKAEQQDDGNINKVELFRPLGGYQQFVDSLGTPDVRLNTRAHSVEWKKDQVSVFCRNVQGEEIRFQSRFGVIALPLAVLKSSLEISPVPKGLTEILEHLYMGHVLRITFEFKTRFWESLANEPIGFLHTGPEKYFPTWWTQAPLRSQNLVAWQGGPKALEMAEWKHEKIVKVAIQTLSAITGKSTRFLAAQIINWHFHNWSKDPYSLGAYSYPGIDGEKRSWKPVEGTLFFAGEATMQGSHRGTVHGAMESGLRAAQQIFKVNI